MSLFQTPPPSFPQGANSSGTPPTPHDPIAPQGQQPPRRQVATALAMVAILASWPADLEPRLQRPNDQPTKIAPLTLTYGSQPVPQPALTVSELLTIQAPIETWGAQSEPDSAAWNLPPLVTWIPKGRTGTIDPAILQAAQDEAAYEVELVASVVLAPANPSQPPGLAPSTPFLTILSAWQPNVDLILTAPKSAWNVPPLGTGVPCATLPRAIWTAWEPVWIPPPTPVAIAPLTLRTGTQPIPQAFMNPAELAQAVASWPLDLEPRLGRPNDQPTKIAPLTLPTGSQPVPQAALSVPELTSIVASWTVTWDAQTAPKTAGWNVPPVLTSLPYRPLARQILTAWEPPWISPPLPVGIAPLSLPIGRPPTPQGPITPSELAQIVTSWPVDIGPSLPWHPAPSVVPSFAAVSQPPVQAFLTAAGLATIAGTPVESWPAQTAPKSGWTPPPILTHQAPARFPDAIVASTQPPDPLPVQRLPSVVSSFAAVSQPPVRGPQSPFVAILTAWVDPPAVPRTGPSAAWNVPPIVATVPATSLPPQILTAWVEVPLVRQPPVQIAPLTLRTGSQPVPQAFLNAGELAQILGTWPADLEPRLSRPNAQQQQIAPLTLPTGQPPPPQAFLSTALLTAIAATGPEAWDAQRAGHLAPLLPAGVASPTRIVWTQVTLTQARLVGATLTQARFVGETLS